MSTLNHDTTKTVAGTKDGRAITFTFPADALFLTTESHNSGMVIGINLGGPQIVETTADGHRRVYDRVVIFAGDDYAEPSLGFAEVLLDLFLTVLTDSKYSETPLAPWTTLLASISTTQGRPGAELLDFLVATVGIDLSVIPDPTFLRPVAEDGSPIKWNNWLRFSLEPSSDNQQ